jgi:hypothetical protein
MVACLQWPLIAALAGALAYPLAFAASERLLFPADLALWRRVVARP